MDFFTPVRKDRGLNNGGGLLIFVKRNVHFVRRHDLESTEIENIWIEVTSLRKKISLGYIIDHLIVYQNTGNYLKIILIQLLTPTWTC